MKKFSLVLVILLVVASFSAFTVSAADPEILKGTPVIDGTLDEIYSQSYSFTITTENQVYTSGADYADAPELSGTTYLLWDDNYIYVCTTVNDDTLLSVGQATLDSNGSYTWTNDAVEMWFSLDEGGTWGQFNRDAYGLQMGMSESFGLVASDGYESAASINGNTYTVEARFPHYGLSAGSILNYNTQINDILVEDASKIVCIGAQKNANPFKLSANEVLPPVIEIEEDSEEEAPAEQAVPQTENAPAVAAAQTADIAVIVSLIALGASLTVSQKIKK